MELAAEGAKIKHSDLQKAVDMKGIVRMRMPPDVIVLLRADTPNPSVEARLLEGWTKLTPLQAVRGGRVLFLSDPGLLSVGPGVLSFSDKLAKALSGGPR